jgi:hypothetical protein
MSNDEVDIIQKINYGIGELRKGEKRSTMKQAIEKNKVSFWGLKQIDKRLLTKMKQEDKNSRPQVIKRMYKLKRQLTDLLKKKKEITAPKKIEQINNRLKTLLTEYKATIALFDKYEKQKKAEATAEEIKELKQMPKGQLTKKQNQEKLAKHREVMEEAKEFEKDIMNRHDAIPKPKPKPAPKPVRLQQTAQSRANKRDLMGYKDELTRDDVIDSNIKSRQQKSKQKLDEILEKVRVSRVNKIEIPYSWDLSKQNRKTL